MAEEQWRRIAVEALADLQALGKNIYDITNVDESVEKEVDRYMWDRDNYS